MALLAQLPSRWCIALLTATTLAATGTAKADAPWVSQSRFLDIEVWHIGWGCPEYCTVDGVEVCCGANYDETSSAPPGDFGLYDASLGPISNRTRVRQTSRFDEPGSISASGDALGYGDAHGSCGTSWARLSKPLSHFSTTLHFDEPTRVHLRGLTGIHTHSSLFFDHYAEIRLEGPGNELVQCSRADFGGPGCAAASAPWGEPVVLAPGGYLLSAEAYAYAHSFSDGPTTGCAWVEYTPVEVPAATAARFALAFDVCTGGEGEPCIPNVPASSAATLVLLATGLAASGLPLLHRRRARARGA